MSSYIEICINDDATNDPNTSHPVVRIEMPVACVGFDTAYENLIKPALEASGFSDIDKSMQSYFGIEEQS